MHTGCTSRSCHVPLARTSHERSGGARQAFSNRASAAPPVDSTPPSTHQDEHADDEADCRDNHRLLQHPTRNGARRAEVGWHVTADAPSAAAVRLAAGQALAWEASGPRVCVLDTPTHAPHGNLERQPVNGPGSLLAVPAPTSRHARTQPPSTRTGESLMAAESSV